MRTSLKKDKNIVYGMFEKRLYSLSSSIFGGKSGFRDGFFIFGINSFVENFKGLYRKIVEEYDLKNYTGFFTLAKIPDNFFFEFSENIEVFMSIGISHVCFPGKECISKENAGTINIIVVIYEIMDISAAIDIISMVSSIKSYYLCKNNMGYSTPSDAIMVSFIKGKNIQFSGPSTEMGKNISNLVSAIFEKYFEKDH